MPTANFICHSTHRYNLKYSLFRTIIVFAQLEVSEFNEPKLYLILI